MEEKCFLFIAKQILDPAPDPEPDPDQHQLEKWDPDPHQNVLDLPHWSGTALSHNMICDCLLYFLVYSNKAKTFFKKNLAVRVDKIHIFIKKTPTPSFSFSRRYSRKFMKKRVPRSH